MLCYVFFNIEFSSKMFEVICDPLHSLASLLSCECHIKYARGEIPSHLNTTQYYLLY